MPLSPRNSRSGRRMKPDSAAERCHIKIPPRQWKMPVTFSRIHADQTYTLRQIAEGGTHHVPLSKLTLDQKAKLTEMRIGMQKKFLIYAVGLGDEDSGIIDKVRAIEEVEARSEVGLHLIEIEMCLIRDLWRQVRRRKSEKT
jgi:hypothetical protein